MQIFCLILVFSRGNGEPVEDKKPLLDFLRNFSLPLSLDWNESSSVCHHWAGVACSKDTDRIVALRLPSVGFNGRIPPNTVSRLSSLRILSLRLNRLAGEFPLELLNLKNFSHLYLQHNQFSGPLPVDFSAWKDLRVLDLSNNEFNGSIPSSLSALTRVEVLNLANNSFSGKIPDLDLPNLKRINLSNNNLTGNIPKSLQKFPDSAFSGNNISYRKHRTPFGLSETAFLSILAASCAVGVSGSTCVMITCCLRKKRGGDTSVSGKLQKRDSSPANCVSGGQGSEGKIVFFEGCNHTFDMEDLLGASAEILGKGTFGTSYKVTFEDMGTVVVKRLKEVMVGRREFEQQMEISGRMRHGNVAEIKAYYYSKDDKLVVYDCYSRGSLYDMLHGNRGEKRAPLDWDARLRIAIGAARGLAYIHEANNGRFVHGNIKSSNIFLNSQSHGCVGDLGLTPVMRSLPQPAMHSSGYCAPEVTDTRKSTQFSDVYSFGVVLLELLTRKFPVSTMARGQNMHLAIWIRSVVSEEWTGEVFDMELLRHSGIEEEMVELLQIGLACVPLKPQERPKMVDVLKMIEDIRPLNAE